MEPHARPRRDADALFLTTEAALFDDVANYDLKITVGARVLYLATAALTGFDPDPFSDKKQSRPLRLRRQNLQRHRAMKRLLILICFLILISPPAHAVQENVLYFPIADIGRSSEDQRARYAHARSPEPENFQRHRHPARPHLDQHAGHRHGMVHQHTLGTLPRRCGRRGASFKIYVGTNTLGSVNGWSCYTNAAAVPPDDSTLYYTKARGLVDRGRWHGRRRQCDECLFHHGPEHATTHR